MAKSSQNIAGRSAERQVLSEDEINRNVSGIKAILESLLQAESSSYDTSPQFLNNLVRLSSLMPEERSAQSHTKQRTL